MQGLRTGYRLVVNLEDTPSSQPKPPLQQRWTQRQLLLADFGLAVLLLTGSVFRADLPGLRQGSHAPTWAVVLAEAFATLPLAVRRFAPAPTALVVTVAAAVMTGVGRPPLALDVAVGLALYTAAVDGERRTSAIVFVAAEIALAIGVAVAIARGVAGSYVIHTMLVAGIAWFAGENVRTRRRYNAWLAGQVEERHREEDLRRRQTTREQRVRIARELHDVVAHSLTVITVQAGVARRTLQDQGPAGPVLGSIERTGLEAQAELRVILDLLRDDDAEPAELTPAPKLDDLESLTSRVQAAGLPVQLSMLGERRVLSPALELSLYRVVQESLTNVVKHADSAPTTVSVVYGTDDVRVEIVNRGGSSSNGAGPERPDPADSRHGILGMRERISAFGGTLVAEPLAGEGFRVTASVPTQDQP